MARRRRQRKDGMETTTGLLERLKRTRSIVRLVLIVERLWPLLLPLAILAALFAVVSWFGLFRVMPDWARLSLTGAFALAAVASLFPLSRMRWPRGAESVSVRRHLADLNRRVMRGEVGTRTE